MDIEQEFVVVYSPWESEVKRREYSQKGYFVKSVTGIGNNSVLILFERGV